MGAILEGQKLSTVVVPLYPNSRVDFIDVARGLLMVLVVLGHSPFVYAKYLYWFHMPAFFIVSGILHSQPKEIGSFLSKRLYNLLIPYLIYGFIIGLIDYGFNTDKWEVYDFAYSRARFTYYLLLWGGETLKGNFAVFWFINCFLLTVVCFTLAKRWLKKDSLVKILAMIGFVIAYTLNLYLERPLPWDINVVPYTFAYFAIGFYSKDILKRLVNVPIAWNVLLGAICTVLIYLGLSNTIYFKLDLKYGDISNILLGIIIPVLLTLVILMLSAYVRHAISKKLLILIGQSTLPIMYLHMVANFVMRETTGEMDTIYSFLIIGLSIPLLLALLFRRYELTNMLFLGNNSKGLFNYISLKRKVS